MSKPWVALAASLAAASDAEFEERITPFLRRHCLECHGEIRPKGGLRLDVLSSDFTDAPSVAPWLEVIEKLNAGEMPPEDRPDRPTAQASADIAAWLAARIAEGDAERRARREPVSFHRLTREEYAHTVHDLLGVHFDVADARGLNEDDRWRGFERVGSVLSLSASHVEKYLAAAEAILAEAYPETPPASSRLQLTAVDLVGGPQVFGEERMRALRAAGRVEEIRVDLWPGQLVRVGPPGGWNEHSGLYRIRAQVSGVRARDGRAPHLAVRAETLDRLLFERDVVAPEDGPVLVEFEAHLPAGEHEFALGNEVPGPPVLTRMGRAGSAPFFSLQEGRIPWQVPLTDEDRRPLHPLLVVDWVEWEGPLANGARDARARFMPRSTDEVGACLARFAERAFRRPLRAGEIEPYVGLVEDELAAGAELASAVRTSLAALLCSKDFLYLVEGSAQRDAPSLNAWELAARLSYFLWSTMPDERLRGLAASGRIHEPQVLRSEVARLLDDPRARRFVESFTRQWLQLDRVGMFTPDAELYPEYDGYLERSMVGETTAFFGEVLTRDLSLREFLDSDWTQVNPRLARHYGIEGVEEDRFRRVDLEPDHHRGGLLTQASVLSLTSDGTRHRPVHRGVWLAESIFGEVPPPPPASVEPIEPTPVGARKRSVRSQLEAHVSRPSCAACHRHTDPLGFAFENYDAIGRWRTRELVPTGTGENPPVDASGALPDGRSFADAAEFRSLLLEDVERFTAAFVEKLATYALRRSMSVDDRDALERIARESASDDYRLRRLVEALVLSELFSSR